MSTPKTISAVDRTFTILNALSSVSGINLEDLAKKTKLAKPTVYRFLQTLKELGYVKRDEGDRWYLTLKLFSLGARALDHIDLPSVSRPVAERLSVDLGETVHMGVLDEQDAIYILKIESRYTIRMYSRLGKRIPLYCTAIGKTLLAYMDEREQKEHLSRLALVPFTPNTIKNRAKLEMELLDIRMHGIATDREEHEEGITCLAAPIFNYSGQVVAAISVSWPKFRFNEDKRDSYIERIKEAAREISAILGWEAQNHIPVPGKGNR